MIVYRKLFAVLAMRGLKKTDLISGVGISSSTLAKLTHDEPVSIDVIDRICDYLELQPGEIIEHQASKSR